MRFSIVIPSYNNGKWLSKCLESIINQTYQDFEIIVVDDMSTDDSVEVAKKYLREKDTLIVNESKRLNGGTRNVGILRAKGEYIICIDSDDWLYCKDTLKGLNDCINGEDVIFTDYITETKGYALYMSVRNKSLDEALRNITCAIWTKVVKRELLQECLFPEGTLFEDRIQHYRLILKTKTFGSYPSPMVVWNRMNENTISGNNTYLWNTYRFNYIGELYRLYNELPNSDFKDYIKKEMEGYLKQVNEMVNSL